jgi:hypothetical protein
MGEVGRGLFGIAALFIGVAFAALLIGHASGTATVVNAIGGNFNQLLNTVELAGGSGFGGFSGVMNQYGGFGS